MTARFSGAVISLSSSPQLTSKAALQRCNRAPQTTACMSRGHPTCSFLDANLGPRHSQIVILLELSPGPRFAFVISGR